MQLFCKTFEQLTTKELYELLKVRSAVFVVEQNCIYQDIDDKDYESTHVFYQDGDGTILACLRLFYREKEAGIVQMGRVLSTRRGVGLGAKILRAGVEIAKRDLQAKKIYLEAQEYAIGFYAKEGFAVCSDVFLEDGIPHVQMELVF